MGMAHNRKGIKPVALVLAWNLGILLIITSLTGCGAAPAQNFGSEEEISGGAGGTATGSITEEEIDEEVLGGRSWEEYEILYETFCERTSYEMLSTYWGDNPPEAAMIYSPVNLYLSLAMLSEMSGGGTRQELIDLLLEGIGICADYPASMTEKEIAEAVWKQQRDIMRGVSSQLYKRASSDTSSLANSLWFDGKRPLREETIHGIGEAYHALCQIGEMGNKDFDCQIQEWLNKQTGGKLGKQIAKDIETTSEDVLMLLSTILFQDKWELPFEDAATTGETFYGQHAYTCGNTTEKEKIDAVKCDFLHANLNVRAAETKKYKAVSIPMNENYFNIILPNQGVTPESILGDKKAVDLLKLCDCNNKKWENYQVDFSMPKLDFNTALDLIPMLEQLGVKKAFGSDADFTSLQGEHDKDYNQKIYVNEAHQNSAMEVDEKGCSVASYTKINMREKCALPSGGEMEMHCDRPFLFMIANEKGLPLFIGVVNRIENWEE